MRRRGGSGRDTIHGTAFNDTISGDGATRGRMSGIRPTRPMWVSMTRMCPPWACTASAICDMIVDVEEQRGHGLTSEHSGKTYAFCSAGCKRSFEDDPARYVPKVAAWEAAN